MNIEVERITALKGFIQPLLFPFKSTWKDRQILYIGGVGEGHSLLERQFPEAAVTRGDAETVITGEYSAATFDYITAPGLGTGGFDIPQLFTRLLSLLKPGGIISAGVYGYAGYYGLDMVGRIIRNFAGGLSDLSDKKNLSRLIRIVKAVISQLPSNHPALQRKAFIKCLEKGDKNTVKELINLSKDKIFTVLQLLECIEGSGGRLAGWVFPGCYRPAHYVERETAEKLETLPEPQRWKAAELINASPAEHYFFMGKKDYRPVKVDWDSGDLYLWKPVRLPLYRWEEVEGIGSDKCTVSPTIDVEGLDSMELESWQVQFCLSASGASTVNGLLKKPSPQIVEFLKQAVENRLLALLPPSA